MPKGVLWRQHDIFLSSMGGRPFGSDHALSSYEELAEKARTAGGALGMLMIPPFMHGAAQWAAYNAITMGGRIVIPPTMSSGCARPTSCGWPNANGC